MRKLTPPRRILEPRAAQRGMVRFVRDPQAEHLARLIDQALSCPPDDAPPSGQSGPRSLREAFRRAG